MVTAGDKKSASTHHRERLFLWCSARSGLICARAQLLMLERNPARMNPEEMLFLQKKEKSSRNVLNLQTLIKA